MEQNKQKKAILWVRVSTKDQRTKEQKKETLNLMLKDGYTDDRIIPIEGVGASAIKVDKLYKENMNKLFDLIDSGNIEIVYAWALDRVGRDERELTFFRWKLEEKKVRFKTVTEGEILSEESDSMQKLFATFQSFFAADEMRKKKIAMRRGMKESKEAGNLVQNPPFGYEKVRNGKRYKAVINDAEAKVIRDIFDMYVNKGMTGNAINKKFEGDGYYTRNTKSARIHFVWEILHQKKYVGDKVFPAIISKEIYKAAQERLKNSHKEPRFIYDGDLLWFGNGLLYNERGEKFGKVRRDGSYKTRWGYEAINANAIESLLLYVANINQKTFQLDSVKVRKTLEEKIAEREKGVKNIGSMLEEVEKKKKRLKTLYLKGIVSDKELSEQAAEIQATEKELNNRRVCLLTTIDDLKNEIENLRKPSKYVEIYDLSQEKQNEIVRQIIKRVDATKVGNSIYDLKFTLFHGYPLTVRVEVRKRRYTIVDGGFSPYTKGMEEITKGIMKQVREGKREDISPVLQVPFIRRIPTVQDHRKEQLEKYKNKEKK